MRREPLSLPGPERSKFKMFAAADAEALPRQLRDYNGKPMLGGDAVAPHFRDGGDTCAVSLDGFRFSPAVRAGMRLAVRSRPRGDVSLGFCVEGRAKRELPETLLACVQLRGVGAEQARGFSGSG